MDLITKAEARSLGLKRFYDGEPCKNGHIAERLVCNGLCTRCNRLSTKRRQAPGGSQHHNRLAAIKRSQALGGTQRHTRVASRRRSTKKWLESDSPAAVHRRLAMQLRIRLLKALHGNFRSGSAVRDLGCSIAELREYLAAQFQPGMTWDNYGVDGWHVDHRRPLASFDLSDRTQFLEAVHYTNLQPLWAADNLAKGVRVA